MTQKKIFIIYKITNIINNKVYIGQTGQKNPHKRINQHFRHHERDVDLVSRAAKKYGKSVFKLELVCSTFSIELANELERYFIWMENCVRPNGYNIKHGGDQFGAYTPELREKISNQKKEWHKTNDCWAKGKKFSKEHRENMSKVRKGFTSQARIAAARNRIDNRTKIIAINIETGEKSQFLSIAKCAETLGLVASCINRVLNGKQGRKQHKGYRFEKAY